MSVTIFNRASKKSVEIKVVEPNAPKGLFELFRRRGFYFNKKTKAWFKPDPDGSVFTAIHSDLKKGLHKKMKPKTRAKKKK